MEKNKDSMFAGMFGAALVIALIFLAGAMWKGCTYLSYKLWIQDDVKMLMKDDPINADQRINTIQGRVDLLRDQFDAHIKTEIKK